MRNKIKVFILCIVAIIMMSMLVSCAGKPKGTYSYGEGLYLYSFEFDGKKVTASISNWEPKAGEYEIKDNSITVTYEDGTTDKLTYNPNNDTLTMKTIAGDVVLTHIG